MRESEDSERDLKGRLGLTWGLMALPTWFFLVACAPTGHAAGADAPGSYSADAASDSVTSGPDIPASVPFPFAIDPPSPGCNDLENDAPFIIEEVVQGTVDSNGAIVPPTLGGGAIIDGIYELVEVVEYQVQLLPDMGDTYYRRTIRFSGGATIFDLSSLGSDGNGGYENIQVTYSTVIDGGVISATNVMGCGASKFVNKYMFETGPGSLKMYFFSQTTDGGTAAVATLLTYAYIP